MFVSVSRLTTVFKRPMLFKFVFKTDTKNTVRVPIVIKEGPTAVALEFVIGGLECSFFKAFVEWFYSYSILLILESTLPINHLKTCKS
jgi:hypothetical protein